MYYLRDEDTWTKIDYQAQAHTWMKPLQRGKETGLVEIPANWFVNCITGVLPSMHLTQLKRYLDDLPPMMSAPATSVQVQPTDINLGSLSRAQTRMVGCVITFEALLGCFVYVSDRLTLEMSSSFGKTLSLICIGNNTNCVAIHYLITSLREEEDFVFPLTIHPDVSGWVSLSPFFDTWASLSVLFWYSRPHVLLMLVCFIHHAPCSLNYWRYIGAFHWMGQYPRSRTLGNLTRDGSRL